MALDLIRQVNPVDSLKKIDQPVVLRPPEMTDLVDLLPEAIDGLYSAMEIAKKSPDVRTDLVAEVKVKLQDPSYVSAGVIDHVADRINKPFAT